VTLRIVFETHSLTTDNEAGRATGWLPGERSEEGRRLAVLLGERRAGEATAAVFTSDLRRATETAAIAFGASDVPILSDWRLRECDYGTLNGGSAQAMHDARASHLDAPYPGGESWRQAVERVGWFLRDVAARYEGEQIVVIGHVATKWGLDHHLLGVPLDALVGAPFEWREGWRYELKDRGL